MVLNIIRFIFVFFLSACASSDTKVIGYLGFVDNNKWAIQFNDCSVVSFDQAQQYIWFNRELKSISCYTLNNNDTSAIRNIPIRIYSQPSKTSEYKEILKFSELRVSKSGWGTFPSVYKKANSNWFKIADGWVHLSASDKKIVNFYSGSQDIEGKKEHDLYFLNH